MGIVEFLYSTARPGRSKWVWLAATLALAAAAWGCAGAQRQAVAGPVSVPARAAPETGAAEIDDGETPPAQGVHHVVQPGQTLWRIARTYGLTPEELARANGIEDPARVAAGALLFVPGADRALDVPLHPAAPRRFATGPDQRPPEGLPGRSGAWSWPVERPRILSYFGAPRRDHGHAGIDIGGERGDPVLAARSGRVVYCGSGMRGYGRTVILDHGDGLSSLYAHNARLLVQVGQHVEQGAPVALLGRTGNATAAHCHFEIRRHDIPIDPLRFLITPLEAHR